MGELVVQKLNELHDLHSDIHWFCPRTTAEDQGAYFDEDLDQRFEESEEAKITRLRKLKEAEERRDAALEACKIFAFDGSDAKPYQDQFAKDLGVQLSRCEICVREYHRSRALLVQKLETEFESDEVREFMKKFDEMNQKRIGTRLDRTAETLAGMPPGDRSLSTIGQAGMYALFEAMHCIPFLRNEAALQQHFDTPFRLVQTKKKLKLPSYAPGMICFLYSHNQDRAAWAVRNANLLKREFTEPEFEYSVKPFLEPAMARVHILALEKEFLPAFWRGIRPLISKLNQQLITDKLRAMDSNIYTIALEHFQIEGDHFADLLSSYQALMEKAPKCFWEALGTINAQAVAETIFRSPNLLQLLKTREEREPLQLEEKMEWTVTLIKSIAPANVLPPVRSILDQLLRQFQKPEFSRYAQSVTWTKGLTCLLTALRMVAVNIKAGPLVANMIEVVTKDHIESIMSELTGTEKKTTEMQLSKDEQLCLDIVEQTLAMDVAALVHVRNTVLKSKTMDNELQVSGLEMWRRSMKIVRPGFPALPVAILSGIAGLLPLEDFTARQVENGLKPAKGWNDALHRGLGFVSDELLSRLETFDHEDILELVQDPRGLDGLLRLLYNSDTSVHRGAVSVLKVLSEADDRRDCLMHVLTVFYPTAMPAINKILQEITKARGLSPCTTALKVCTDIFSCLTDSSDGLLRSSSKAQKQPEQLEAYWSGIWDLSGMIFQQMEDWSQLGYSKDMMQDFCRTTMEFAEHAFDQYAIIASTLQGRTGKDDKAIGQELLAHPKNKFLAMARWLRLRDDYLITKAVSLTVKILGRLREMDLKIDDAAANFIEDVAMSSARVKTKVTMQQKAELHRALEKHLSATLVDQNASTASVSNMKQRSLEDWASGGRSSGASTPVGGSAKPARPGTIDVEAWTSAAQRKKDIYDEMDDKTKELLRSMSASDRYRQRKDLHHQQQRPAIGAATARAAQKAQQDCNDFLAKRAREKEEAAKRKQAVLAKASGVGVGSGVAGLGDMGKDHSLKGQNVMVSSDEESEDDEDDELDEDLFGPSKKKLERPNVNIDGAVGLKIEQKTGPTRIQRTARSAKDMRARLAPDLTPLHRTILGWDFFHTGDYPPGSYEHQFKQVASSFTDPTTYQSTFLPLLTLEAWQGLVKSREENVTKPYEVRIQNRTNVDSFIEISSIIGHAENRDLQLQEADIILLSKAKKPADDATAPHCLARIYRVKRQKAHCEVVYQLLPNNNNLAPSLAGQTVVYGLKVQSITPLEREYGALQALQYYDLCTQIIKARPSKRMNFSEKQIASYRDIWDVNPAQSEAINAALENEGFSLIQGPPGSGKTKTIVAIVGGLLTTALSSSHNGTKISVPKGGVSHGSLDQAPRKLLVCAPSNAAVDELVLRLKDGIKTKNGQSHKINIVRIGRSDAINTQVLDVTMDELVSKRLGTNANDEKKREQAARTFKMHEEVSSHLRDLYAKRDSGEVKGKEFADLENEIVAVRRRKNELGVQIDNVKDSERNAGREAELNRKKAQQSILDEAHVICATLSGSGHDMFQSLNIEFETVIIDEAAQCVEMSSLIPLKYGCVKCIMVGDPKQLPPTVFSKEAAKFQYEQSLFVRMQNNFADEVHLLDTQYRMHPEISVFPSQTFYDGLLKDGRNMLELRQQPWHASGLLAPYRFFDVAGQHQAAPRGHSLVNLAEIDIAIALYNRLRSDFPDYDYTSRIGVITPYKSQLRMLKERFSARCGNEIFDTIEFNTTDAFQGRESEIIIFSCVRASPAGGIGFLQDIRRMNVGLTRAKSSLWVLGNSESLVRGQYWRKLVEDAKARDCYTTGNLRDMLARPSSAFPVQKGTLRSMPDASSHVAQMYSARPASSSTVSSDRPPAQERSTNNFLQPWSEPRQTQTATDGDRMEGVRYRLEDRVGKKTAMSTEPGSDRSAPRPRTDKISEPQDVEMADTEDTVSRGATPGSAVSRAGTPLSGDESRADPVNGHVKPNAGNVARPVAPLVKKRPAASPFMPPRKHPKPRP